MHSQVLQKFEAIYTHLLKHYWICSAAQANADSLEALQQDLKKRLGLAYVPMNIQELENLVGIVPVKEVPQRLVHYQATWLGNTGLTSNFFWDANKNPILTGERYESRLSLSMKANVEVFIPLTGPSTDSCVS